MQTSTAPPAAATHDYSAAMRVWHWGNAALVSGQLLTILFLKVIVNARSAVPEFQAALAKSGGSLTDKQGRAVAHVISDRIWTWHVWIGVTLAAFWLFWTVMQALDPAGRRFGRGCGRRRGATSWPPRPSTPMPGTPWQPSSLTRLFTRLSRLWS
ncbi:MAG: cytochrome b/b6 domain-containing protein [Hymenobacter sp.]